MSVNDKITCCCFFFALFLVPVNAQIFQDGLLLVRGVVVDADSGDPIPGVAIVRRQTGDGVVSNSEGKFELKVSWSDSLYFSAVMYKNITLRPPDSLFRKEGQVMTVKLKSNTFELNAVNVQADESVPLAMQSDVFKEKPRVGDYFFRPLSVIFYYASKRERRKRKLVAIVQQERMMEKFEEIYNREKIAEYSGLVDSQLDSCVVFCNQNINLTEKDTEDVVKWKMMQVISAYYKQR